MQKGDPPHIDQPGLKPADNIELPNNVKPPTRLPTLDDFVTGWPEFCREFGLSLEVDFNSLRKDPRILSRRRGFDWLVYCPKGFTTRHAFELCRRIFKNVWEKSPVEWYSLERSPERTILTLCRANVEPDSEWLDKTADEMQATEIPFLDVRERYMLEAFYYWLTKRLAGKGKHLDGIGWTRCPRSRTKRGSIACASYTDDGFGASSSESDTSYPDAGGREAISIET